MKYAKPTILVVAPDFPYPPHHGGLVDTWRRIKVIHDLGFNVDLIATVKCDPPREHVDFVKRYIDRVHLAKRGSHLESMFSLGPAQIALRSNIRAIQLDRSYEYTLLETEFGGGIFANPSFRSHKTILRIQNNEAQYLRAAAMTESKLHKRLYYALESWKSRSYSQKLMEKVDTIWFISTAEHQQFVQSFHQRADLTAKAFVLPAPLENYEWRNQLGKAKRVLFLGNLFTPLNRDALRWYIENVHPRLTDIPEYRFVVAGSTQGKSTAWLTQMASTFANIDLHCDISDPRSLYESSSVFVNPMLAGAGVKLKTINAIEAGLPVVTTPIGIEGTGLEDGLHVLVAADPSEFASKVRLLLERSDIGRSIASASWRFLSENYDHSAILAKLLSKLGWIGAHREERISVGN